MLMVETEVTILSRVPFIDTTDPAKPKNLTRVIFQLPDGRVDDMTIPTDEVKTDAESKKIAEKIKSLPAQVTERLKVDI